MSSRTHLASWQTFYFLWLWQKTVKLWSRPRPRSFEITLSDWIKAGLQLEAAGPTTKARRLQEESSCRTKCLTIHFITRMCLWSPARHRRGRVCIQTLSNALRLSLLSSSGEPPHICLQNETTWGISQQLFSRGWNLSLTNTTHKIVCFLVIFQLNIHLCSFQADGYLRPCRFTLTMSCFRTSKAPPVLSSTPTVSPSISLWIYLALW